MSMTKPASCVGKTVSQIEYATDDAGQCRDMYIAFSDGSHMGVGVSSDGTLASCMVPNVPDEPGRPHSPLQETGPAAASVPSDCSCGHVGTLAMRLASADSSERVKADGTETPHGQTN